MWRPISDEFAYCIYVLRGGHAEEEKSPRLRSHVAIQVGKPGRDRGDGNSPRSPLSDECVECPGGPKLWPIDRGGREEVLGLVEDNMQEPTRLTHGEPLGKIGDEFLLLGNRHLSHFDEKG